MVKRDDGTECLTWNERTINNDIPVTFDDDRTGGKDHFVPASTDALKK